MTGSTTISRGAHAQNEHGQGDDDEHELDVLAVDLAGRQGELSESVFHGSFPFLGLRMILPL